MERPPLLEKFKHDRKPERLTPLLGSLKTADDPKWTFGASNMMIVCHAESETSSPWVRLVLYASALCNRPLIAPARGAGSWLPSSPTCRNPR